MGNINMKSEWISFKQGKPTYYKTVLLCCVFIDEVREPSYALGWLLKGEKLMADWFEGVGEIILSKRNDDLFIWNGYPHTGLIEVYWMELPEPPKVGD